MVAEIQHIFFSTMSNPELKQEDISLDFEIAKRPTFKFHSKGHETVSNISKESHSHHQDQEKKEEENEGEEQQRIEFELKQPEEAEASSSLREKEEEELEDGFRTPTSLDHRISVAKKCPPAPRKPKALRKRKQPASQNSPSCRHPLDFSNEVEFDLLFPIIQHSPLSGSNQNSKKIRREDPK